VDVRVLETQGQSTASTAIARTRGVCVAQPGASQPERQGLLAATRHSVDQNRGGQGVAVEGAGK